MSVCLQYGVVRLPDKTPRYMYNTNVNYIHGISVEGFGVCSMSPGWVLPYLGMAWRFRSDDQHFWDFRSDYVPMLCLITIWLCPYVMPHHDLIDPHFMQKKINLSLSNLVPEIHRPKVVLIFHKNVLFSSF